MIEERLYSIEDKEKWWGPGKWVEEFDVVKFEHLGFDCKIMRGAIADGPDGHIFGGYLCGYVRIPKENPLCGKHYDDIDIDCHRGLTFSELEGSGWWIGFDCAHSMDIVPSMEFLKSTKLRDLYQAEESKMIEEMDSYNLLFHSSYKDMDFCITQCKIICEQLNNHIEIIAEKLS